MKKSLSKKFKAYTAHIEFTSACNLNCIYCPVSQPDYSAQTMKAEIRDKVSCSAKMLGFKEIILNGHGETTIINGWEETVSPLLESGVKCKLISNASKLFSEHEITALSKLHTLTISCDSFSNDVYRKLRRGGSLENILGNISAIRHVSQSRGEHGPSIGLSCVLGADNSPLLEEFILFARAIGIDFLQFCHLKDYPEPPNAGYQLMPLSTLSNSQLLTIRHTLNRAIDTNRPLISLQAGITEEINSLITTDP